jgi:hypothetical protein
MTKHKLQRAKQVLRRLVEGVDPETGEELPKDTVLHRAEVIRALLTSVEAVEEVAQRASRRSQLPPSVGQRWSEDEERRLTEAFQAGQTLEILASNHGRTVNAIEARLESLGLITASQRTTHPRFPLNGGPEREAVS